MTTDVIQQFLASSLEYFGLSAERKAASPGAGSSSRMVRQMVGLALATGVSVAALAQPAGTAVGPNSRIMSVKPGAASMEGGTQRVVDPAPAEPPAPVVKRSAKHKKHAHRSKRKHAAPR